MKQRPHILRRVGAELLGTYALVTTAATQLLLML